jgi:hypothetical protein
MKRSKHTEEQIIAILQEQEAGTAYTAQENRRFGYRRRLEKGQQTNPKIGCSST